MTRNLMSLTLVAALAGWSASARAQAKDEKKPADKPAAAQPPAAKPAEKPAADKPAAPAAAKPGDKPADAGAADPHMEAFLKASTPGPEHAKLKALEGSWTTVTKSWHDPAGPPMESKGTREAKWILGGRYLEEHYTGDMMGMPFQGMGIAGYDNVTKRYMTAWVDNFSTAVMLFTGTADASGKVITFTGDIPDPFTGKSTKARTVTRLVDDKNFVFEMYGPDESGKEVKMMEITHNKK